jgi:hypothetical protein
MYEYKITILKWVDVRTFDGEVDLGFRVHLNRRFRCVNIEEPATPDAVYAALAVRSTLLYPVGSKHTMKTVGYLENNYVSGLWLVDLPAVRAMVAARGYPQLVNEFPYIFDKWEPPKTDFMTFPDL